MNETHNVYLDLLPLDVSNLQMNPSLDRALPDSERPKRACACGLWWHTQSHTTLLHAHRRPSQMHKHTQAMHMETNTQQHFGGGHRPAPLLHGRGNPQLQRHPCVPGIATIRTPVRESPPARLGHSPVHQTIRMPTELWTVAVAGVQAGLHVHMAIWLQVRAPGACPFSIVMSDMLHNTGRSAALCFRTADGTLSRHGPRPERYAHTLLGLWRRSSIQDRFPRCSEGNRRPGCMHPRSRLPGTQNLSQFIAESTHPQQHGLKGPSNPPPRTPPKPHDCHAAMAGHVQLQARGHACAPPE